jgi:hypothetical protein
MEAKEHSGEVPDPTMLALLKKIGLQVDANARKLDSLCKDVTAFRQAQTKDNNEIGILLGRLEGAINACEVEVATVKALIQSSEQVTPSQTDFEGSVSVATGGLGVALQAPPPIVVPAVVAQTTAPVASTSAVDYSRFFSDY